MSTAEPSVRGAVGDAAAERSRLLVAASERDRLEKVLLALAGVPSDTAPVAICEAIGKAACTLTGARLGAVVLPELLAGPVLAGPDAARVADGFDPQCLATTTLAFDGNTVYVPDTAALQPGARGVDGVATLDGRGLRCLLAVPIHGDRYVTGVLLLAHHRARAFSERHVVLVGALAQHLGHLVEMGDAVVAQTRIATALQESLLPPVLPRIAGLELAARYRPSGSGNLVGGDFYDVFPDAEGGWYLLLGDASGTGPEAAGLAGIARYTARALATTATGPAAILTQMNAALLRAAADGRFCTATLARFRADPGGRGAGSVVLASAGHPPGLLHRASGAVEVAIEDTGLILGVVEDAPVGTATCRLEPGDALVLYTDGIIEARDGTGDPFGETRVVTTLEEASGRSAEGIVRRLERAVLDHRAPDEHDDMAIVAARARYEEEAPAPFPGERARGAP